MSLRTLAAIQLCCKAAESAECSESCSTSTFGNTPDIPCSTDAKVANCLRTIYNGGARRNSLDHKASECCDRSPRRSCRMACRKTVEDSPQPGVDVIGQLINGGCGQPVPHNEIWQCLLTLKEEKKPVMDLVKLQCCFRSKTTTCRNLCFKSFGGGWKSNWLQFKQACHFHQEEEDLQKCLMEVDEPCKVGCDDLPYCNFFNGQPNDMYRGCNRKMDAAAHRDATLWKKGVVGASSCTSQTWKLVACVLHTKPCNDASHSNRICKNECIHLLSNCIDTQHLASKLMASAICNLFSPADERDGCISLTPFMNATDTVKRDWKANREFTLPCQENPCGKNQLCVVNKQRAKNDSRPYRCISGCKMGELSSITIPILSYVLIKTEQNRCPSVLSCLPKGTLLEIGILPCKRSSRCKLNSTRTIENNHTFQMDCNKCLCYAGKITCSEKICSQGVELQTKTCNCTAQYMPVCGPNGKTYPSVCKARCAGIHSEQLQHGSCSSLDPCRLQPCSSNQMCIPSKRMHLTVTKESKKHSRFVCLSLNKKICTEEQPVCDTYNQQHANLCSMHKKNQSLAYYGKCLKECAKEGPVCGQDGETYVNECTCLANRVPMDYKGLCRAVPEKNAVACFGIPCSVLPPDCAQLRPPNACCATCGGGMFQLTYSQQMLDDLVKFTKDMQLATVEKVLDLVQLSTRVLECNVFGFLESERQVVVLVLPETTKYAHACAAEARRIRVLLELRNPTLTMFLPLAATVGVDDLNNVLQIEPVNSLASLHYSRAIALTLFTLIYIFIV